LEQLADDPEFTPIITIDPDRGFTAKQTPNNALAEWFRKRGDDYVASIADLPIAPVFFRAVVLYPGGEYTLTVQRRSNA
ncbi:MAG: hypothetical protein WA269_05670, partial [Candidatus Udaeobacter sp.]